MGQTASVISIYDGKLIDHLIVSDEDHKRLREVATSLFIKACRDLGMNFSSDELAEVVNSGHAEWNDRLVIFSWPIELSIDDASSRLD